MPPKKSTRKKKAESITSVELVDTTPVALPPTLPEVQPITPVECTTVVTEFVKELQAKPKELEEIVVVGDFEVPVIIDNSKAEIKHFEPDDIRDAAGDPDETFSFPPPDSEPIPAERRPEWLKYEQDNPLFDNLRSRRTDIQENQIKMQVPSHTLRGMEDSDVEADIGDMV
jgi:hypothetical protein